MSRDTATQVKGTLPWGVRIASGFLEFFAMLVVIPMCLSAVLAISTLLLGRGLGGESWEAFAYSGGALALFIGLLATVLGSAWLAGYLRATCRSQEYSWKNPLSILGEAVLVSLIIYSTLAVSTWCVVKLVEGSDSLVWPVVWAVVGAASIVARKRLNGEGIDPGSA